MRTTRFKATFLLCFAMLLCASIGVLTGCQSLRFEPTEAQKLSAWQTNQAAVQINQSGAQAGSEATKQLVDGTNASLTYFGLPKNLTNENFDTTVVQAQADATLRPDIEQVWGVADSALDIGIAVAALFSGAGALKIAAAIKTAKEKSQALKEIVKANDLFQNKADTSVVADFRDAQSQIQSVPTTLIVAETRATA